MSEQVLMHRAIVFICEEITESMESFLIPQANRQLNFKALHVNQEFQKIMRIASTLRICCE